MTEKLLQYIWQFGYFNSRQLKTTEGEPLTIIHRGILNSNQGPDFLNATIKAGDTTWVGNIELHINADDWWNHGHDADEHFSNVILHVVWVNNARQGLAFPTLELHSLVSNVLLSRYNALMQSAQFIPCQSHIESVPQLSFTSWKERLVVERLQLRAKHIEGLLKGNNQHWEETFWWMLARNFGIKINSDSFERIARSIPINILAKHKNQIHQLEAILLGQAALLDKNFEEDYPNMLRKEYQFLQKKYLLKKAHAPLYFMRMRPANFPTIRLAQLAMLTHQSQHLFSLVKEAKTISEITELLKVTANDYWHYHYRFDEKTSCKPKTLGDEMIQNICINTITPMLFAYGYYNDNELLKQRALEWLYLLAPEKNSITKRFQQLNIENKSAFDSQALIQLKNNYCNYKLCLQCAVGNQILRVRVDNQ